MMCAMCSLCSLCAGYAGVRGRYVGASRAMRERYTWDVRAMQAGRAGSGLAQQENAKNPRARGHNAYPPMREQVTFLRAWLIAQRVIAPTLQICSKKLLSLSKTYNYEN